MSKTILSFRQKKLLHLFAADAYIQKNYYLSGGTALSEYYLHHRLSEDLDYLTKTEVDPMSIQVYLKAISQQAEIEKIDFQQSFNRNLFFLHFDDEIIKTEFTFYPFEQLEEPKIIEGTKIDSLLDIAVNKTFTMYQKPRCRDFIDLYLIIQEKAWSFAALKNKARVKFDTHIDPLQMAKQLLEVDQQKDIPRMITPLKPKLWRDFWIQEADKLKHEALE